ncbi:MAG: hypothetical protein ACLRJV_20065 [Eubacteriales bacterium]
MTSTSFPFVCSASYSLTIIQEIQLVKGFYSVKGRYFALWAISAQIPSLRLFWGKNELEK